VIDTGRDSARLRDKIIDPARRAVLISRITGSAQEPDLSEPPNCGGHGRVHHFTTATSPGWPPNPLPVAPAIAALGLPPAGQIRAQVFQVAACNWRCWYCYVPYPLLSASPARASWLTAGDLAGAYLACTDRPPILVLSGGQPDLVPEWAPWTLEALAERGAGDVYVWSDDNLSADYFWRYLTEAQRQLLAAHPRYGRVCCFKGFDPGSFAFNTGAAPELYDRQFDLFARLAATGMDLYAYVTLTGPDPSRIPDKIARFADRLQQIAETLPLRAVPLEITTWGPVTPRLSEARRLSLRVQAEAVTAWNTEMAKRFAPADRSRPVTEIRLTPGGR